ncbi:retron St85 family RNA-directed DNA polymerase [Siccibacter turicensis]
MTSKHFHLIKQVTERLSWSRSHLLSFVANSPNKYKVFTIPKRSTGQRVIAHPAKKLKLLQSTLVSILANSFRPHDSAFAYKNDISIKDNAETHKDNSYLLKMDFSNFFNSITPKLLFSVCDKYQMHFSNAEQYFLMQALFWNKTKSSDGKLVLSVGAPSSPLISNFVMKPFDHIIYEYCKENEIVYTRYADDLTFSTSHKNLLFSIPTFVKNTLIEIYSYQISINDFKTIFSSKGHNRHITGITITNENNISIGRERKRAISSMIHKYSLGLLQEEEISYLQGLLSFACYIEKDFKKRMVNKYSFRIITELLTYRSEL